MKAVKAAKMEREVDGSELPNKRERKTNELLQ